MHKFLLYRYLCHGRFVGGGGVGGSKRKRPNDVVGEKIDMFVAPKFRSFCRSSMLLEEREAGVSSAYMLK